MPRPQWLKIQVASGQHSAWEKKQQFEREPNANVWMTRNEVACTTNCCQYRTCVCDALATCSEP